MTYSDKNPAWGRLMVERAEQRLLKEISIAQSIQEETGCTWGEALKAAAIKMDEEKF